MRAVLQRVSQASVSVDGAVVGQIEQGLLVLLGIGHNDTTQVAEKLADKIIHLRIFSDTQGRFHHSLIDIGASMLLVSQFTLYADTGRGRRPSFTDAAAPELAEPLVEHMAAYVRAQGIQVETGRFGAMMQVALTNDGPVTILLERTSAEE